MKFVRSVIDLVQECAENLVYKATYPPSALLDWSYERPMLNGDL